MAGQAELIASIIGQSVELSMRYIAGFAEAHRTTQLDHLPNHLAWQLGHLSLTMQRAAEKITGQAPSEEDFVQGRCDGARFEMESVAFGSSPTGQIERYPPLERCVSIYRRSADRLASAVRSVGDAGLRREVAWGQGSTTVGELATRMVFHNGFHTGQVADLRRGLSMPSVFAPQPAEAARERR